MNNAEILQQLKDEFGAAILSVIEFHGETTAETDKQHLKDILGFLTKDHGFEVLMDLTAVDYLESIKRTKVVYWLHNPSNYQRFRITVFAHRDEALPSVVDQYPGAYWYERELFDMFGVCFTGNPDMKRILMPDDWIGHPLLKDYALTEEPVEFKFGVKPKVPSEIIPYVRLSKKY